MSQEVGGERILQIRAPKEDKEELEVPKWHDFVVSKSGSKGRRTLHQVGRCFRIPSVHYKSYKSFGTETPPDTSYDWICLGCWPPKDEEDCGDESSSSSEEENGDKTQAIKQVED